MNKLSVLGTLVLLCSLPLAAQTTLSGTQIVEKAALSVALVLAAAPEGGVRYATAIIVREDGILLTAYHAVKGAREVQVRLKNGEIYDQVQLLASDERRDVAALRISAKGLPAITLGDLAKAPDGSRAYVISHPRALPWSTSEGILSAVRMADDIPGAGQGYRVIQFTAAISPGSSGGVLLDAQGGALGIVVGSVSLGQSLNFAVPLESVMGLAAATGGTPFASGKDLKLPTEPERVPEYTEPRIPAANPTVAENSEVLSSRDPQVLMRNFRTIDVQSRSTWIEASAVQAALEKQPEFLAWGLVVVNDPKVADVMLTVDRVLFTWDFTYELTHRNTSIVLHTGKVTSIDGLHASSTIARRLMDKVKTARAKPAPPQPKQKEGKG